MSTHPHLLLPACYECMCVHVYKCKKNKFEIKLSPTKTRETYLQPTEIYIWKYLISEMKTATFPLLHFLFIGFN